MAENKKQNENLNKILDNNIENNENAISKDKFIEYLKMYLINNKNNKINVKKFSTYGESLYSKYTVTDLK